MAATTPRLALPYPTSADSVDVPRDVNALATALDGLSSLSAPIVTTLPVGPVEAQECVWRPGVAATVGSVAQEGIWRMRFLSGRWRYLGGSPLVVAGATPFAVTALGGAFLSLRVRFPIPAVGLWQVKTSAFLSLTNAPTPALVSVIIAQTDAAGVHGGAPNYQDVACLAGSNSQAAHGANDKLYNVTSLVPRLNFESFISAGGYAHDGTVQGSQVWLEPVSI